MGCGTSKDGAPAAAPSNPIPPSTVTTPATHKPAESQPPQVEAKPPPPAAKDTQPSSEAAPAKGGARFNDDGGNTVSVEEKTDGVPEPARQLKPIVSFQQNEKSDGSKGGKPAPDTPFVKKGEGFDEMFEEDDSDVEEEKKQAKKNKRKQKGVNFDAAAEGADGTKKGPAPGTPFVRLGAAFDDLYDEDEDEDESDEDSDEDEPPAAPPPKKEKKKRAGGIKFDDDAGEEDTTKEKLAPGTPFVKMGGGFDDLYDEDGEEDDSDEDSDEDDEPPPQPKKKAGNKKAMFTEDTEEKDSKLKQPGTPFVKLGGFNDLYNEDDDEDEDEDSDEDSDEEPPPQPAKKSGARKKAGFAEDTEDHNAEDKERVPGTPFVKIGGFNDLYDEDGDEDEDSDEDSDEDEDDAPAPEKPAEEAAPAAPAPAKEEPQDPSTISMDLPAISKVRVA